MSEEKKIIIDSDWKEQAKQEKEKLASEQQPQEKSGRDVPLPKGDINQLISMLATQALFSLGVIATPETADNPPKADFEMAKFHIDMLDAIDQKTKGNLTTEEAELLTQTLSQLRMAYVELSSKAK